MSEQVKKIVTQTERVTSSGEIIKFESSGDSATYGKAAEGIKFLSITNGTIIDVYPESGGEGQFVNNTGTSSLGDNPVITYNLESLPLPVFATRLVKKRSLEKRSRKTPEKIAA